MTNLLRSVAVLVTAALFSCVLTFGQSPSAPAGQSNIAHLYLVEKDPATFQPVPGGAWGKLVYTRSGASFDFVFNGHKLDTGIAYTLIYYPDPWPGNGAECLGHAVANTNGDVHIQGRRNTGSLPVATDLNANPETTTEPPQTGAKIWLVLSTDINCSSKMMVNYHPTEYLFEMRLITYSKTQ
jgi:hypothetical protein